MDAMNIQPKKDQPDAMPEEIMSMVKSIASQPHRLILFLQQSSVEWSSSLWLDTIREIDPSFSRTTIVASKFDNRLKEFKERWEIDSYLSASSYLGDNIHPFFVALPNNDGTTTDEEFRSQICQVDIDVLRHMREKVKGGFNEEKYAPYIGFTCLRKHLESKLQNRYKEAVPATLALLEQRCIGLSADMSRLESKLQATTNVAQLRRSAFFHVASICTHLRHLLDGTAKLAPRLWGLTTEEEQKHSGIVGWPGINVALKPPNFSFKLYGGAAIERVMYEFHSAAYSMECPPLSTEEVANKLLFLAERGLNSALTEAAADIAHTAAQSFLTPLMDTACNRLAFVLQRLFELAMECSRNHDSKFDNQNAEDMDGYVGFLAAVRRLYYKFVEDLSKQCKQKMRQVVEDLSTQCKQKMRQHVDLVTSPYYQFHGDIVLDLSDSGSVPHLLDHSFGSTKKGNGNSIDGGAKKKHAIMPAYANTNSNHHSDAIAGADDLGSKPESLYCSICSISAQYFAKMREVLLENSVPFTSVFRTPCRERLFQVLGSELFALEDDKFMNMFVAPGDVDTIQNERESLLKRRKTLLSCLNEFKNISSNPY